MREIPDWLDKHRINEAKFCEAFLKTHPMVSVNHAFFTKEGRITDEDILRKAIYDEIKNHITSGATHRVNNLLEVLRMECCREGLPIQKDRIHVANGTYFLDGRFEETKDFCRNRLPVRYDPTAPTPTTWLHFLHQLLESEDILTLQEFMGYCCIPSTKGQKMLLLTGKGGEGKSRIGVVLRAMLGDNMNVGHIAKVEASPFAKADLEHALLLLDDDMKLEALPQTNNIKAIITAELPMDLERKGQQSYQGDLYVRFIALGNGTLQSLYDRSVGFFRRQIILTTKDKPQGRKDDPFLGEKMCQEKEGIFLWALDGLHRLISNDYEFTLSRQSQENLEEAVSNGNNVIDFLASTGYIQFKADSEACSRDLYAAYRSWCEDNALHSLGLKSFCSYLKQNERRYNLEYTNKINIGNKKQVRGFVGIEIIK